MTQALLIPEIEGTGVTGIKQILFRGGDYSPSTNNVIEKGTATTSTITISGLVDAAARQSVKVDLGALRATKYAVKVAIEWHAAADADSSVSFFWSPSESATAAVGNDGGASGADAAYTGHGDLGDSLRNLVFLGTLTPTTALAVHKATIGEFQPTSRYGSLVILNESGETLAGTDGIETAVAFNPVILQGQAT